jgi:Tol biopolymer transport system component
MPATQLRQQRIPDQRPLVSTAGRIVFVVQHDGTDDFYRVNADGSGLTRLTNLRHGSNHQSLPLVARDGTRLAVSVGGVLIVRLDRPGVTLRLERPGGALAWAPDGKQLASLAADDQKKLHLWVFNADGSGEARDLAGAWESTAAAGQQSAGDLVWSPDAKRFAFVLITRPAYRRPGPSHDHLSSHALHPEILDAGEVGSNIAVRYDHICGNRLLVAVAGTIEIGMKHDGGVGGHRRFGRLARSTRALERRAGQQRRGIPANALSGKTRARIVRVDAGAQRSLQH